MPNLLVSSRTSDRAHSGYTRGCAQNPSQQNVSEQLGSRSPLPPRPGAQPGPTAGPAARPGSGPPTAAAHSTARSPAKGSPGRPPSSSAPRRPEPAPPSPAWRGLPPARKAASPGTRSLRGAGGGPRDKRAANPDTAPGQRDSRGGG